MADKIAEQFLVLPEEAPADWVNLLTGETFEALNQISLVELFKDFPVALLTGPVTAA